LRPLTFRSLNVALALPVRRSDTTGMKDVERDHQYHHQKRVEPIEENLVLQQNARVALEVLNDLDHAPNEDEQAHEVDVEYISLERQSFEWYTRCHVRDLLGGLRTMKLISHWLVVEEAVMEGSSNEDKDDEADQLDEETGDDDVLTGMQGVIRALGGDAGT
jgi:hypothetical protein